MHRLRIPLLLLVGLALGLALGLYLGWEVYPTEFVDANPAFLDDSHKREYVRMIASAYAVEGDLALAQERLAGLGEDAPTVLTAVMLDAILAQQTEAESVIWSRWPRPPASTRRLWTPISRHRRCRHHERTPSPPSPPSCPV